MSYTTILAKSGGNAFVHRKKHIHTPSPTIRCGQWAMKSVVRFEKLLFLVFNLF
jgi:hypothetical protein